MRANMPIVQRNNMLSKGFRTPSQLTTIDVRTKNGAVVFTHTSDKNNLKETIELFLRKHRGTVLENIDFSNLDLSGVNLNHSVFRHTRFDNSVLFNAEICSSRFLNCSFNGAGFCHTKLYDSEFLNSDFFRTRFYDLGFCSALFTNEQLKWFRKNDQLSVLDSYKADFWMKLMKNKTVLPDLKTELTAGRVDGSCCAGPSSDFCGTLSRILELPPNEIPGVTPDASSPVEQWFLLISVGMTPKNSEVVKITLEWIRELERNISSH